MNPRISTTAPATSVEKIVSMLNVIPIHSRVTWWPISMLLSLSSPSASWRPANRWGSTSP
jgi:hypothetical protein